MVGRREAVLGVVIAAVASTLSLPGFVSAATGRAASVTVQISLTRDRIGAGTSIPGTATVTNHTAKSILVKACANDGWLFVGLVNHFVKFDPPIATVYCSPSVRLAPGPNRFPITVRTTYLSCTNRGPQVAGPRCTPKGPPPLPNGYYDTKAIILGLPKGTVPPPAVGVTVLPKPTSKVGSTVELMGVAVTLRHLYDPASSGVERQFFAPSAGKHQSFPPRAGFRYVSVMLTIKNTGRHQFYGSADDAVALLGTDSRWYLSTHPDSSSCTISECRLFGSGVVNLKPGQSKTGVITLSVPEGVRIGLVRFDSSPRSANWAPVPAA